MGIISEVFKMNKEAVTEERIPARYSVTKESFDILLGHEKGKMTMLRGERSYETDEANSTRGDSKTGFKKIDLANGLHVGRTYIVLFAETKTLIDAANANVSPAMTGKVHLHAPTVEIPARFPERWTVLKHTTAVV